MTSFSLNISQKTRKLESSINEYSKRYQQTLELPRKKRVGAYTLGAHNITCLGFKVNKSFCQPVRIKTHTLYQLNGYHIFHHQSHELAVISLGPLMKTYATQFTWKVHKPKVRQKNTRKKKQKKRSQLSVIKTPTKSLNDLNLSYFISYNLITTPYQFSPKTISLCAQCQLCNGPYYKGSHVLFLPFKVFTHTLIHILHRKRMR